MDIFDKIDEFRKDSMLSKKVVRGTTQNDDVYFQHMESRNKFYDAAIFNVVYYMDKINKICNNVLYKSYDSNVAIKTIKLAKNTGAALKRARR